MAPHIYHPYCDGSNHQAAGLDFGSSQIMRPIIKLYDVKDGNGVLRLKQSHPLRIQVFGDLIEDGDRV